MRRLSIIDLEGGQQPISNEDGSVWVVFNGEIYNHRELRRQLTRSGHTFRTASDTETIVHLYEELGARASSDCAACLPSPSGTRARRQLLLARDRLGIKPLYFAEVGDGIVFASELKPILQLPEIGRDLSWEAVGHLFTFLATPASQSIVNGVRKLEPARIATAAAKRGVRLERYWDVEFQPDERASEDELVERLRELLVEAVTLHQLSDVPIGAFLSGGIDSSAVVATMAQLDLRPGQDLFDWLRRGRLQRALPRQAGCGAVRNRTPRAHSSTGCGPDCRGSCLVSRRAVRRHVGDSDLHGLEARRRTRQRRAHRRRGRRVVCRVRQIPDGAARAAVRPGAGRDPAGPRCCRPCHARTDAGPEIPQPPRARWAETVSRCLHAASERTNCERCFDHEAFGRSRPTIRGRIRSWSSAVPGPIGWPRSSIATSRPYLPLDILTKVDRMTMAHSIEARPPLLDHRVVEFAATIPARYRLRDGTTKYLLKRAMRGVLPDGIIDRPKHGFAVPLARWFRGELAGFARGVLLSDACRERGLFDTKHVERLIELHRSGRDLDLQLWTLLSFELWCRRVLDVPRHRLQPAARATHERILPAVMV